MSPRLSLCMIVKNEEKRLLTAIQSVSTIVDEIIIVDTGSTDQTVALAKKQASLVVQVPWNDDFAAARNVSIEEATGDWVLILDADETVDPKDLPKVENWIKTENYHGCYVQMINRIKQSIGFQEEHFPSLRLFRNHPSYRFTGAIHEQITSIPLDQLAMSDIRILHHGNEGDKEKRINRSIRNIRILTREAEKCQDDAFCQYNLGVEFSVTSRYREAIHHFERAKGLIEGRPMWASRFYKILVYCYLKEKQWEKAAQTIEEGILHFPDFTDLFYLKGMLLVAQKKFSDALRPFYKCLALGDATSSQHLAEKGMGTEKAHFALGSIYEALGESKKAQLCYHNAFCWNPALLEAGRRWIKLLLDEMSISQAIHRVKAILDESNPIHLLALASLLADHKEYSLCCQYADRAFAQGAEWHDVFFIKALCFYLYGKKKSLNQLLEQLNDEEMCSQLLEKLTFYTFNEINAKLEEGVEKYPLSIKLSGCKKKMKRLLEIDDSGLNLD